MTSPTSPAALAARLAIALAMAAVSALAALHLLSPEFDPSWRVTAQIDTLWPQIPAHRFEEIDTAFGQYEGRVFGLFLYWIDNEIHHRGQAYVYLRALGIEPPPRFRRRSYMDAVPAWETRTSRQSGGGSQCRRAQASPPPTI